MKKTLCLILTFLLVFANMSIAFASESTPGSCENNPIVISTPAELQQAAINALSKSTENIFYLLTADIDFTGYSFVWDDGKTAVPFGIDSNPFKGTFDGGGHTIKGFNVAAKAGGLDSSCGFFGAVGDGAVIKNLGLIDTNVTLRTAYKATGALIGTASGNVTIENTFLRNTKYNDSSNDWAGGFICIVKDANVTFNNCYATGTSANITAFMLRGEFFAWSSGTNTVSLNNCYTDSNQFAPKTNDTVKCNLSNCYANSEGTYKAWNNYNTNEWLGTKVTSAELKNKAEGLGVSYAADSNSKNNGYPVLKWEVGETLDNAVIEISTPKQLQDAAIAVFKNVSGETAMTYKLMNDIDFTGYSFVWDNGNTSVPFGVDVNPFTGTFDGNGHTIKGMKVVANAGGLGSSGFFGAVGDGAVIKNLGLIDTNVKCTSGKFTGALIGTASGNVTIENTFIRNTTYDGDWSGGFICLVKNANVTFNNCYATGTSSNITSHMLRGDFFAWSSGTNTVALTNCYTDTNQFAPKTNDSVTYTLTNCYANSEGMYTAWNNYNTNEWLGTKISSEQLKRKTAGLRAGYASDVNGKNNGYPVLRWEVENDGVVIDLYTAGDLQQVAIDAITNSTEGITYVLKDNIDFTNYSFVWDNGKTAVPFGLDSTPFTGTFDGNGHTIKGFKVVAHAGGNGSAGFFGAVGDGAVIKNLGLIDTSVTLKKAYKATGALIGTASGNVTIENTFLRNTTYNDSAEDWAGGFICIVKDANVTFNNCYATGTSANITAFMLRGEFFAWSSGTTNIVNLNNCYTDTNQFAPNAGVKIQSSLTNCYANAEGSYNDWNNYNTGEWVGTKVTSGVLKTNLYGTAFAQDANEVNGGYPVLAWEAGLDEISAFTMENGTLKDVTVIKRKADSGMLYAVVYDSTTMKLKDIKTVPVSASGTVDVNLAVPSVDDCVKVFMWMNDFQPLMSTAEIVQ